MNNFMKYLVVACHTGLLGPACVCTCLLIQYVDCACYIGRWRYRALCASALGLSMPYVDYACYVARWSHGALCESVSDGFRLDWELMPCCPQRWVLGA